MKDFNFQVTIPAPGCTNENFRPETHASEYLWEIFCDAHSQNTLTLLQYMAKYKIQSDETATEDQKRFIAYMETKLARIKSVMDSIKSLS